MSRLASAPTPVRISHGTCCFHSFPNTLGWNRRRPTLDQLEAVSPNIRQQLLDWRQMRVQQGADPGDYAAFRQHLIELGAPDPGEQEFTGFRD